jgi:hypothetical protein
MDLASLAKSWSTSRSFSAVLKRIGFQYLRCLESLIITLSSNLLESHMFNAYLGNLIENELAKISQHFSEFCSSEADFIILYEKIKETVYLIVSDL